MKPEGRRSDWVPVLTIARNGLPAYDFCLLTIEVIARLRRGRTDARPLRRRWGSAQCEIEVQDIWV